MEKENIELNKTIEKKSKWNRIKNMKRKNKIILSVVGCLALAGIAGGVYYYESTKEPAYITALRELEKTDKQIKKIKKSKSVIEDKEEELENEEKNSDVSNSDTDNKKTTSSLSKKEKAVVSLNPAEMQQALENKEITQEEINEAEAKSGEGSQIKTSYTQEELEEMFVKVHEKGLQTKVTYTSEENRKLLDEAKPFVQTIQNDDRGWDFSKDFLKAYDAFKNNQTTDNYQKLRGLLDTVEISLYKTEYYPIKNGVE